MCFDELIMIFAKINYMLLGLVVFAGRDNLPVVAAVSRERERERVSSTVK